jgi:hypothetical protein
MLPAVGWRVKRKCAVLSTRGAWRARPGHPPSRYALAGSGPGGRQDRFVGPLTGLVTCQAVGLVGWRPEARRSGVEAQVLEDWRTTAGHSMTARTRIVPPHRAHTRGSISYIWRIRQVQDRRRSRGA